MAVSGRFTMLAITAVVLTSSCGGKVAKNNVSDNDATLNDTTFTDTTFTDSRDGQVYKTVKIGEQVWMAQNLKYPLVGSKCFAEDGKYIQQYTEGDPEEETLTDEEIREKCEKYGRLYDWETAKKAVPKGWHLPSKEEWETLANFVGKEFKLLEENNFSTNGFGDGNNFFVKPYQNDEWWSATEFEYKNNDGEIDATNAYVLYLGYEFDDEGRIGDKTAQHGTEEKNNLYYVRCIKDAPPAEKKAASEKPSKKKKEYGVSFNYTDADELKEYKSYDSLIKNKNHPRIIFTSEVPVKDFSYIDLDYIENEDHELVLYPSKVLFSTKELRPEKPFVASWIEVGIMSVFGFSYRDENGRKLYFAGRAANYGGDPEDYDGPALVCSQIFTEKAVAGRYQYFDDENTLTLDLTDTSYTLKLNDVTRKGKAIIEFDNSNQWVVKLEGIKWDKYDKKAFSDAPDFDFGSVYLSLNEDELTFQNRGDPGRFYAIFDGIGEKYVTLVTGERLKSALASQEEKVKIQRAKSSVSTFTDSRDGKKYKTVTIGAQTWMAQNLNFAAEGSKCYKDDDGNCAKYGRLYDWETAKKAVPAGWHLPTDEEWTALTDYVGGARTAGKYLKSAAGWDDNGSGSDDYGFSALPGGGCSIQGGGFLFYYNIGDLANFWSATGDSDAAWYRSIRDEKVGRHKDNGFFSVRCVKDR